MLIANNQPHITTMNSNCIFKKILQQQRPILLPIICKAHFSSISLRSIKTYCPFTTLGLSKSEEPTYSQVKKAFLSLALKHHPDSTRDDANDAAESTQMFIEIKRAFDQFRESNDGIAILNNDEDEDDGDAQMSSEAYESWFYSETGKQSPNIGELSLSLETIKEITAMMKSEDGNEAGVGELDRSGGIWAMAKMISQDAENNVSIMGGVLRLEEGEVKSPLNRRRKRR